MHPTPATVQRPRHMQPAPIASAMVGAFPAAAATSLAARLAAAPSTFFSARGASAVVDAARRVKRIGGGRPRAGAARRPPPGHAD